MHKIQRIKIDEIIPYENNPRNNKNKIKRNTLKTLRGQILSGDFEGLIKE